MSDQLITELIQFSWTLCTVVFAAQGWVFLQEFKGNRIWKKHHWWLAIAFTTNLLATVSVFTLLHLVLDQSLLENRSSLVTDPIQIARTSFIILICLSTILTSVSILAWQFCKNDRQKPEGKQ